MAPFLILVAREIIEKTPSAEDLIIFSDSIIDFRNIDSRVPLKLKFNWVFEGYNISEDTDYNSIGVESFEIIKDNKRNDKIDLEGLINSEAEMCIKKNGEVKDMPHKTIYLTDLNLDSYLDIGITEGCGKESCNKIYFIYNPIKTNFQRDYASCRPMANMNAGNGKIIVYTYADGMQWYMIFHAYVIHQGILWSFIEVLDSIAGYQGEKYDLYIYKNANGDTIKIDTIPK